MAASVAPSRVYVGQLCVGSVAASTGLIIINKSVMQLYGFRYVLCLTTCHFLFTTVLLEGMKRAGAFEPKALPTADVHRLALGAFGSIASMNLSLATNSIGVYQMGKLSCIPYMVLYQSLFLGAHFTAETKAALGVVVLGMATAVVTDMQLNALGCVYSLLSVLTTSHFQTWQSTKQREHQCNPIQIQYATAMPTAGYFGASALLFDGLLAADGGFFGFAYTWRVVGLILLTCFFAIAVNTLSYVRRQHLVSARVAALSLAHALPLRQALIGQTSAVTYQVVGHAKTCMVLLFGFVVFGYDLHAKNLFGIRHGNLAPAPSALPKLAATHGTDTAVWPAWLWVG